MRATHESGRSLIEMLGVISLIAVITVSGLGVVDLVRTKYRAATIQYEVEEIVRGVFDLYSFHRTLPSSSGEIQETVCENKILQKKCDGNRLSNDFGGSISVSIEEQIGKDKDGNDTKTGETYIKVEYNGLPDKVTRQLMCNTDWYSVSVTAPDQDTGCRCGKSCSFGERLIFMSK